MNKASKLKAMAISKQLDGLENEVEALFDGIVVGPKKCVFSERDEMNRMALITAMKHIVSATEILTKVK